jgi:N-acyl-L-homoserine lactone synthetase
MPVRIFKYVIAANGCPVIQTGPTLRLNGHETTAAYIDVSPSTLDAVRRRTGIRNTILELKLAFVA